MERRALIAIALSVAVLLAWQLWVGGPPPPELPRAPEPPGSVTPAAPATKGDAGAPVAGPLPRAGLPANPVAEVVTPLYRASFAPDGTVTAWTIEYRGSKRLVVESALRPLTV